MARLGLTAKTGGITAGVLCAVAAFGLVLPASAQVRGAAGEIVDLAARGSFASFTPASVDSRLAAYLAERGDDRNSTGRMMRFTPVGAATRRGRSVTVAVRVNEDAARAISVRSAIRQVADRPATAATLAVAPTSYSLGIARDYQSFATPITLPDSVANVQMPDLAQFRPSRGKANKPSRFGADISLERDAPTGRSPRSMAGLGDQSVDVEGRYSVTRNLDVTAGVRVTQDRDRLAPIEDNQDAQAVYVGTKFRF